MSQEVNEAALDALKLVANAIQDIAGSYASQHDEKRMLEQNADRMRQRLQHPRKNPSKKATKKLAAGLKCVEKAIGIKDEFIQFLDLHGQQFRAGLKRSWEPRELQKYVLADAEVYMAKITEFNSRTVMTLKPLHPAAMEGILRLAIAANEDWMPDLVGRVKKWDTDMYLGGDASNVA